MSEWQTVAIGEICDLVTSGGTPLTSQKEYYHNGSIPWVKTKEVNQCRLYGTENHITQLGLDNSSAKLIPENSIIIAMYGDGKTAGRVALNKVPVTTNQACCNLILNKQKANYDFVFYNLMGRYDELVSKKTGSGQQNLNGKIIKEIEIDLPSLPEQKAIASVLSSLDDKIDLLHRQNKTLEAMAETLFRQWFIEEAKEDWEEVQLKELVFVIDNRGKTPPYLEEATDHPIIEVNALTKNGRAIDYSVIRKYVTKETFDTWFRQYLEPLDIVLSTVGSIGSFGMFFGGGGCVAQNIIGLRAQKKISNFFLYQWLVANTDEIKELDIGSVQPSIKVPHLLSLSVKIPMAEKLELFDTQVEAWVRKILANTKQIQTLENLRDTLLPKLMSGEVRVQYQTETTA